MKEICKKEQEGLLYENGVGKKIVSHFGYEHFCEVMVNVNDL